MAILHWTENQCLRNLKSRFRFLNYEISKTGDWGAMMPTREDWTIYAQGYLGVWLSEDKWWTKIFNDKTKSRDERCRALANFARYYAVSRNLRTLECEATAKGGCRLQMAAGLLDSVDEITDVALTVSELSSELTKEYWQGSSRICISAASKFLWLKFKSPIIIFDSQALASLYEYDKTLKEVRDGATYQAYGTAWRELYKTHSDEILQACTNLFEPESRLKEEPLTLPDFVSQPWFMERIFDQWLWDAETPAVIRESGLRLRHLPGTLLPK